MGRASTVHVWWVALDGSLEGRVARVEVSRKTGKVVRVREEVSREVKNLDFLAVDQVVEKFQDAAAGLADARVDASYVYECGEPERSYQLTVIGFREFPADEAGPVLAQVQQFLSKQNEDADRVALEALKVRRPDLFGSQM